MTRLKDIPISENHRWSIASTLVLLDEMLCEFERLARGQVSRGLLYEEVDDLSAQQKQDLLAEIEALRDLVAEIQSELALEGVRKRVSSILWARCSHFWENLVELESRYLRRYGELSAEFASAFDPQVNALIEQLDAISQVLRRKHPPRERSE